MTQDEEAIQKLSEACKKAENSFIALTQKMRELGISVQQFTQVMHETRHINTEVFDEQFLKRLRTSAPYSGQELRLVLEDYRLEPKSKQRHDYWNVQGKRRRWK